MKLVLQETCLDEKNAAIDQQDLKVYHFLLLLSLLAYRFYLLTQVTFLDILHMFLVLELCHREA